MSAGVKLSSVDGSFLYLETPETPMHVGSMAIFKLPDNYKGDFFEEFKAQIQSRLHLAPVLRWKLERTPLDIDNPSWVEDEQFDIDRHIFRASLAAIGGFQPVHEHQCAALGAVGQGELRQAHGAARADRHQGFGAVPGRHKETAFVILA